MWCWNCGERTDWDDVVCPECGAELDGEEDYDDDHGLYGDEEDHY